jgi:hypothetical protein
VAVVVAVVVDGLEVLVVDVLDVEEVVLGSLVVGEFASVATLAVRTPGSLHAPSSRTTHTIARCQRTRGRATRVTSAA